jgi:transaldolase
MSNSYGNLPCEEPANARLAYEIYATAQSSDRWKVLCEQGAKLQRLLWASTGVKDKAFPATRYVTELVASDTVNTIAQRHPCCG